MIEETCCWAIETANSRSRCPSLAEWAIQSENKPLEPTFACTEHVGDLLEAGVSIVWPERGTGMIDV